MTLTHQFGDRELLTKLLEQDYAEASDSGSREKFERDLGLLWKHYDKFALTAPASLDAKLQYYPHFPNPFRMITSSFAHGDWFHIIGNMIFYFAFATALEILIGNALLYVAIVATIMAATSVAYSLYTALFGLPIPSLGFSGVVMGMIGLSAFLMPRARIRTFFWFLFFARTISVPAWLLAAWYIGWDTAYLFTEGNGGGTNLVAHVAGGFTGYLLGWWWLRDRKWLIADELEDEIDHMRAQRADRLGALNSHVNQGQLRKMKAEDEARRRTSAFNDLLGRLYKLNTTGQDSTALVTLLEELPQFGEPDATLSKVFRSIRDWPVTRFTLCFARHYIGYLLAHGRRKEALNVCDFAYQHVPEFVLADPSQVLPMATAAEQQQRFPLASALVRDVERRYGPYLDVKSAKMMETRLVSAGLDQPCVATTFVK
jgi:membrane associated rhomboid family serine protease